MLESDWYKGLRGNGEGGGKGGERGHDLLYGNTSSEKDILRVIFVIFGV